MEMYTITIETEYGTEFFETETVKEATEFALDHFRLHPEDYIIIDGPKATIRYIGERTYKS